MNRKRLIDIIKEEIGSVLEIEYSEPDQALMVGEDEVLVRGYGYLTIDQIRSRIERSGPQLAEMGALLTAKEEELQNSDPHEDNEMLVREIESIKTYLETQGEVMDRFKETLVRHEGQR